jgi:aspartate 1-decarboxylase
LKIEPEVIVVQMWVCLCRAKIQNARVTAAELDYEGSITIDEALLEASGILPNERIQVLNHNNGERLETYVMVDKKGSGTICLNGPAARLGHVGDTVTLIAYSFVPANEAEGWKPKVVRVDGDNRPVD